MVVAFITHRVVMSFPVVIIRLTVLENKSVYTKMHLNGWIF